MYHGASAVITPDTSHAVSDVPGNIPTDKQALSPSHFQPIMQITDNVHPPRRAVPRCSRRHYTRYEPCGLECSPNPTPHI